MILNEFEIGRMRTDLAAMRLRVALLRWSLDWKYNPDQPRVPAGNSDGGRWLGGGGNAPGDAGGTQRRNVQVAEGITGFTRHGINRAISRGVSPSAILDAVKNPIRIVPRADGSTQFGGAGATVVLDPAGAVITVWPK